MSEHLIYMLSKIEYGRISKSKFMEGMDKIIESLRKDFPHIQPLRQQNSFRFEFKGEGAPELFTDTDPMLTLLSPNKTWGVRITPNFLIVHTKSYEGFEVFHKHFMKVVEAVQSGFDTSHISSVGMRFFNSFTYDVKHEFSDCIKRMDFLQPDLNSWKKSGSNLSARYIVGDDAVNVNSGVMIGAPKYLPDLAEMASDLVDVNSINIAPTAHLDIDSFYGSDNLVEFNMGFIRNKIEVLRDNANAVYYETVKTN